MSFTLTISTNNRTHGHDGGARRPEHHQGGSRHNGSIFGSKSHFGFGTSRNHGGHHGFEFNRGERFEGHRGPHRHHRHHGGSERFAPQYYNQDQGNKLSLAGGLSGAAKGAATGAMIGSIIPGVGTVIGGAVGAVGGFIKGLFG